MQSEATPGTVIRTSVFDTEKGPPLGLMSCDDTSTIKNWFLNFCNTENPDTPNIEYYFWLYLRKDKSYVIRLRTVKWISDPFEPPTQPTEPRQMAESGSDFSDQPISPNAYAGLKRKEIFEKIESELQSLAQTSEVANSLLFSKLKSIAFTFNKRSQIKLKQPDIPLEG